MNLTLQLASLFADKYKVIFLKIILGPFSLLYWIVLSFRNWCYDTNLFKSYEVPVAVVCVGNIKAGGTGKTPFTQYLLDHYSCIYKTAVLSRGYGRKTKGFILADIQSTAEQIGDEPLQILQHSHGNYAVAVCEDRVEGVTQLLNYIPDLQLVILDDGFQHRKIKRDVNILLTEYQKPFFVDYLLPLGLLRESRKGAKRADVLVVTKTPSSERISDFNKKNLQKYLQQETPVFYTGIEYKNICNAQINRGLSQNDQVILITGIANPEPLVTYIKKKATIIEHVSCKDHYSYRLSDIQKLKSIRINAPNAIILTTEKDWVKLFPLISKEENLDDWYYLPIGLNLYAEKESLFSAIDKRINKRLNNLLNNY